MAIIESLLNKVQGLNASRIQFYTKPYTKGKLSFDSIDFGGRNLVYSMELDNLLSFQVTGNSDITQRKVEGGFALADHIMRNPKEITMEFAFSDVRNSLISNVASGMTESALVQQFANHQTSSRALNIAEESVLQSAYDNKWILEVYYNKRFTLYDNYIIKSFTIDEMNDATHGFKCTLILQELDFFEIVESDVQHLIYKNDSSVGQLGTGQNAGPIGQNSNGNSILMDGIEGIKDAIGNIKSMWK